jgi:hypothetical protein
MRFHPILSLPFWLPACSGSGSLPDAADTTAVDSRDEEPQGYVVDPTFGAGGFADVDLPEFTYEVSVAVLSDGDIALAAFHDLVGTPTPTTLCRFDSTGTLDVGFALGCIEDSPLRGARLVADGASIRVAGVTPSDAVRHMRFAVDGALDPTFGTSGIAELPAQMTGTQPYLGALLGEPEGTFLLVGTSFNPDDGSTPVWVSRVDAAGQVVANGALPFEPWLQSAALEESGALVLLRYAGEVLEGDLLRLNQSLTLDSSFGSEGVASAVTLPEPVALATTGGSELLVAVGNGVQRFDSEGVLDPTFGDGGYAELHGINPAGPLVVARERILVGMHGLLAATTLDGRLDESFGNSGLLRPPIEFGVAGVVTSFAMDGENVIAAGYVDDVNTIGPGRMFVFRLIPG